MLTLDLQRSMCLPVRYGAGQGAAGLAFSGSFPSRFTFSRPLQQWSPVLTRQTRVGPGEDRSGIKWEAFTREMLEKDRPWEVASAISGDSGCSVAFAYRPGLGAVDTKLIAQNLLEAVTYTPQTGRIGLFSHLSPSGSSNLDDLPCIERGDEHGSLVIATRREGSELHLWRRLYFH
jgi:hypothetical protein